jgi:hypothetical protein
MNETPRRMKNLGMAVVMLTITTGCLGGTLQPWYGYAPTMDAAAIPRLENWAGTRFEVRDDRPPAPKLIDAYAPGRGEEQWNFLSKQLVAETRRIILQAVGPATGSGPRNLMIIIVEYEAIAPTRTVTWIGRTTIKAQARQLDVVEQEWTGQARVERINWNGTDTGGAVLNEAYQAAMTDLFQQLANAKADTTKTPSK